jgi:8-oxo-dGTP pyrophosphatase MutT (NUDIX family)
VEPAKASSAVILIRDKDGDTEIFMGQRHERATFASTFVFPGGLLNPEDTSVHHHCSGLNYSEANERLSLASGGLDYYSAALRELFEETGVLLATDSDGAWVTEKLGRRTSLAETQQNLIAGNLAWSELLSGWGIKLAIDRLHYVGHWETPLALKDRFSTRFFLTDLPSGQKPEHDGEELIDSRWLKPAEALELHKSGEIDLPFPHMKHLETLASLSTPDAQRDWARNRWQEPVTKIRPWLIKENDERRFLLPGEPDYPDHA